MATQTEIEAQRERDRLYVANHEKARTTICAECEGGMVVRWNGRTYELLCGMNKSHMGTKPAWHHSTLEERRAREVAAKVDIDQNKALTKYSGSVALEKVEAEEIILSLWPDAPKTDVFKAALICQQYGLNPLMRHLYLVKYDRREKGSQDAKGVWQKGKVIGEDWSIQIGIGATRLMARRAGPYSYEDDTPRLMTEAEQVKILGAVEKDKYWAITRLRGKDGMTAQGYGQWGRTDPVKGADKGNSPQNMAFIRSERAALDKLFPEKFPAGVGVADERYIEGEGREVDTATGEITETVGLLAPPEEALTPEKFETIAGPTSTVATTEQATELARLGVLLGYKDADTVIHAILDHYHVAKWAELKAADMEQTIKDWTARAEKRAAKAGGQK